MQQSYFSFINLCYQSFNGWGEDAKLKTGIENRKVPGSNWQPEWEVHFAETNKPEVKAIQAGYNFLIKELAGTLGIGLNHSELPEGVISQG